MSEVKVDMEQLLDHVLNDKPISIARMREWLKHLVRENERLKEIDERECLIAISLKKENDKLKAEKKASLSKNLDKEELMQQLYEHLGFNGTEGTYIYILTRVKEAFSYGTMTLHDFVEIDGDFVGELADFILEKIGVPITEGSPESPQSE